MKRLFMVDYKENGICKHQCVEMVHTKQLSDAEMVKCCHAYVGEENELDGVFEVFDNLTAAELNEISQTPLVLTLRHRLLFVNVDEVNRCVEILKEANDE